MIRKKGNRRQLENNETYKRDESRSKFNIMFSNVDEKNLVEYNFNCQLLCWGRT